MGKNECNRYLWLHGYRCKLSRRLNKEDGILPIVDTQKLGSLLNLGFSYLTINDGVNTEVVKVERFGNDIKITRGTNGTEPQSFPPSSCVFWEITKSGIYHALCDEEFNCCDDEKEDDCGCFG